MSETWPDGAEPRWLTATEMRASNFVPAGPEIDYGMRWGVGGTIRVSFAPRAGSSEGFLYAHDRQADRYLVLAGATTGQRVDAAWRELQPFRESPDAFLALVSVGYTERPMPVDRARDLLLHCVDRELAAFADVRRAAVGAPIPFEAARTVVVQRSARVSAESLLREAVGADAEPVVVRYRVPQDRTWSGQVAGRSVGEAASTVATVADLAERRGLAIQATSVTHGWSTVAAARVPELAFAARRDVPSIDAPRMAI